MKERTMNMDLFAILVQLFVLVRTAQGSDLDYTMDILQDLDRSHSIHGITEVSGLHNESKAFLFRDMSRSLLLPPPLSSRLKHMFRGKSDFTFLATVQQKTSTSGVLFSIHDTEKSWFELQSSGIREELVFRYCHRGQTRSEPLPYRLADGRWHHVALTVSSKHLQLHVDCNRIYERLIDPPQTNLPRGSEVWLGQHGHKHGLFKGLMQDVKFVFAPNGFVAQCPNLNRTCPTCSDFLSLVQGIMDLQDLLSKMSLKTEQKEEQKEQQTEQKEEQTEQKEEQTEQKEEQTEQKEEQTEQKDLKQHEDCLSLSLRLKTVDVRNAAASTAFSTERVRELGYGTLELGYGTLELGYGTLELGYGTLELRYGTLELGYGTLELRYGTLELGYSTLELRYGTLELRYGTLELELGYGTLELGYGTLELRYGTLELGYGTLELRYGTLELGYGTLELRYGTLELGYSTLELRYGTLELRYGTLELDMAL
uniref:Laminin G domain-containing protein n=1 Tax=Knipowitschia caucasica TaxID=637954 RepID=A0AAV2LNF8_KNICA